MTKEKTQATTAERLREAMAEAGKKQIDLANETGLQRSAISRYLSGEYEPKQKAINKLAVALNVSEMWLWGFDVPKQRTAEQKKKRRPCTGHRKTKKRPRLLRGRVYFG